jgi:hypothetical protein
MVGYGAYNLCFDRLLGKKQDSPFADDFFAQIRRNNFRKINLVRVICFRHSRKEGHPETRATPLYITQTTPPPTPSTKVVVNPAFLDNLSRLVARASETGFVVQVSIFHNQALYFPPPDPNVLPETPELLPPDLTPFGGTACERLKNFFNPRPQNPNQLVRQKELVAAVVGATKSAYNVIYEIGNELVFSRPPCKPPDNCALAEWMNLMRTEIFRVTGYVQTRHIGTSTGRNLLPNDPAPYETNEAEIFKTCPKKLVSPDYFDFHSGQWLNEATGVTSMQDAINRVKDYTGGRPLIINDDGALGLRTPTNVEKWAREAFSKGLHYASKQSYPNGSGADFNFDVLRRLEGAA